MIKYICGLYLNDKRAGGIYLFLNGRLLNKYKLDIKVANAEIVASSGIVCLINISYDILAPSEHKNKLKDILEEKKNSIKSKRSRA